MQKVLRSLASVCLVAVFSSGCERTIIRAAARGNMSAVERWVERGKDVNVTSRDGGVTMLHHAAGIGHVEMVQFLLKHQADFTMKGTGCGTPLQWAARAGHVEAARLIVQHGADVNDKGPNDHTALHDAAGAGHLSMVEFLLSQGAEVNGVADYGLTPLLSATLGDHAQVAELLLVQGADPTAKFNGRSVRQLAKSREMIRLLDTEMKDRQ